MSAYETRLVGWLIGNATGLSSRQMLAALNFALQSEFAHTELNGNNCCIIYLQKFKLTKLKLVFGFEYKDFKKMILMDHPVKFQTKNFRHICKNFLINKSHFFFLFFSVLNFENIKLLF